MEKSRKKIKQSRENRKVHKVGINFIFLLKKIRKQQQTTKKSSKIV